jgi:hypothetical protein
MVTKKKFKAKPSAGKIMCCLLVQEGNYSLCGATEEAGDVNYKSETREERKIFPLA